MRKWMPALAGLLSVSLLAGCSGAAARLEPMPYTLVQERAAVFSDGQQAGLWRAEDWEVHPQDEYWLTDFRLKPDGTLLSKGTLLLRVHGCVPEKDVPRRSVSGESLFPFDAAWNAVLAWYGGEWPLWDLQTELAAAYEDYCSRQGSGVSDSSRELMQSTQPSFWNQRIVCFQTTACRIKTGTETGLRQTGAVFDRETGAHIDGWALFTRPPEEVWQTLRPLAAADNRTEALPAALEAPLSSDRIVLTPEGLELVFPADEPETAFTVTIGYPVLDELLQPWAFPDPV